MQDSQNICQKIIEDILEDITKQRDITEKIDKRLPSPDHEDVTDNQTINDSHNPDDILLTHIDEIIVQQNLLHEGDWLTFRTRYLHNNFKTSLILFSFIWYILDFIKSESSITTTSTIIAPAPMATTNLPFNDTLQGIAKQFKGNNKL